QHGSGQHIGGGGGGRHCTSLVQGRAVHVSGGRLATRFSGAGKVLDVLVIGAGPAGLTCALYLARYHRSLLLADAGDSRARYIPVSHNTPGWARGVGGERLLEELREQAARHGAVPEKATVRELARDRGGFLATVGERTLRTRCVVLATGVVDTLPVLAGVDAAVRDGVVRLCPVCDAYETAGRRIAVYGSADAAARHAR